MGAASLENEPRPCHGNHDEKEDTMKITYSYNEAIKTASYMEVHRRIADNRGDSEVARDCEQRVHGMAELISTLYGTWDDDDYSRTFNDIMKAADDYFGK